MGLRSHFSPGRIIAIEQVQPETYSVAQIISDMGLIGAYRVMGSTQSSESTGKTRGLLNRGFRTYGDSLYYSYLKNLADQPPNPDQTKDWSELQVWHAAYPGKNNTSTNVCIRIQNFQGFWFHKTSHAWATLNTVKLWADQNVWHDLDAFVSGHVTATRVLQAGNSIPGFPFVLDPALRGAPTTAGNEAPYRSLHSVFNGGGGGGAYRFALPAVNNPSGGNLGGFMLTCDVDLFPISGSSFNGTTEILMQLGSDFMYPGGQQGQGSMMFTGGGGWTPNTTSSKFCYINPTIGQKTRVHCTTYWDEAVNGSGVALNTKVVGHMGGSGATKETSVFAETGAAFWMTTADLNNYPITVV